MRVRHKPYARPELAAWPYHIDAPEVLAGRWREGFSHGEWPFHLELGCGKGGFLAQLALRDAEINHLGVDIKNEMLVVAKRNIERQFAQQGRPIDNVLLTNLNIEKIETVLRPQDDVRRIYINFCNPWYKSGHAKHRLTHPRQLIRYREFLCPGGEIYFKTDDERLFADSLRYFPYTGFEVIWQTKNLHDDEPAWNLRTEHEEMFSAQGIAIKACIAVMRPAQLDKALILKSKNV